MDQQYDYIIAGAGAAGLSLAWKILQTSLADKRVLIIDANLKSTHDKTWCFWHAGEPPFSDLLYHKWGNVEVSSFNRRFTQPLSEYPYYCLRSVDFKNTILEATRCHPNFELKEAPITKFTHTADMAVVHTEDESFTAEYVFQSCFTPAKSQKNLRYPLLQHFWGWEISTPKSLFDDATFTLMDFDESFNQGVAFIYLLPWSDKSALIEYTIFSDQPVARKFYEEKISLYLNNRFKLTPLDYKITRRESGEIPMQDRPFAAWYNPRVMNIGITSSITKPSTGYTFKRIQQHTDTIVSSLLASGKPKANAPSSWRYKAYDLWLLQIIHDHPREALRVFNQLFQKNNMDEIFRFLGEDTNLMQDLKIMNSVPYIPFLRAIWKTKGRLAQL